MDPFSNFAFSTVVTAPSPAISGTSMGIGSGDGAAFPDPAVLGAYNLIVLPPGAQSSLANAEIIRVSARTGDTFGTIARGQEGTSPIAIAVGYQVIMALTKKTLTDIGAGIWAAGAGGLIDRQVYTATGAFTWTKPAGARMVRVRCVSGGGGGGAGRRGAALSVRCGGGGGAGGTLVEVWFVASDLGATVAGSVGIGGAAGAAQTVDSTDGAAGGIGGNTDFGTYMRALSQTIAAGGGTAASGAAGVGVNGPSSGFPGAGGAASTTGGAPGAAVLAEGHTWQPPGGAAGGGITSGDVESAGVLGRTSKYVQDNSAQVGGTVPGGNATVVASPRTLAAQLYATIPSYGGASGAASKTTAGGSGGAAQGYGAGGGGGGASLNGFASGAGGAGAPGVCIVETFG